jgi:pyridoxal kinase
MANILSIQSTVLNDLVGNQAARSILQPRKHSIIEVPTIILTSHKGQKSSLQLHSSDLNISRIFTNVRAAYKINTNDLTIVGYLPSKNSTKHISRIIKTQRNVLLDPVIGDIGVGIYVNSDVAKYFQKIFTKTKYLSANFFEWGFLNKKDINQYQFSEIVNDLKNFCSNNKSTILIRSIPKKNKLINVISSPKGAWSVTTPEIKFKTRYHGAGDLTTALFAHYLTQKISEKKILENLTNDIFQIISKKRQKNKFKSKSLSNL